ncbi:ParA family protein [Anaerobacillus sp. 1_MG-2023]|uniref:ParA family protein n=1 Tax=Anaerobacillus sp. 1_MG-2023 TaxID=3062655 RepID=UPI0026E23EC8|nr:ParA family protein [Anaerobacillus sp. 1_MG-2023]MDO6657423.1 ParA family protein [Anaerobacillus sp. 1_MG-2023]
MIVGVVSFDSKYKELLQAQEEIELAPLFDKVNEDHNTPVELEALLLDGKAVSYDKLSFIREVYPEIPIFYKMHNISSHVRTINIERICSGHRITPIHENYTMEQVVSDMCSKLFGSDTFSSKRIVSFFGTHSGAGVSTTTMNVGKAIADRVHEKVLVLSLNAWDPADYFTEYKGAYLNDLKLDLKSQNLTQAKLGESLHQYQNLYHLAGNRDIKLQRYYTNKEIAHLIDVAKEMFDLILIDGGTHFDTACATQAYVSSNLRFVVTNQDDKGYRGYFPHVFQQLIEPAGGKRSDFMLILNRFQTNMSLINEKDLESELDMNRIATIPDMDILGSMALRQKKFLYDLADTKYKRGVDTICNLIISEGELTEKPLEEEGRKQKGWFGLFGKKAGVS